MFKCLSLQFALLIYLVVNSKNFAFDKTQKLFSLQNYDPDFIVTDQHLLWGLLTAMSLKQPLVLLISQSRLCFA